MTPIIFKLVINIALLIGGVILIGVGFGNMWIGVGFGMIALFIGGK